jgi:transcriptional regulator with XRE-family HTH domain
MTPERFQECLDHIGWSLRSLADRLGMGATTMRRWAEGTYPVPQDVAQWLQKLAVAHERNPAPIMNGNNEKDD